MKKIMYYGGLTFPGDDEKFKENIKIIEKNLGSAATPTRRFYALDKNLHVSEVNGCSFFGEYPASHAQSQPKDQMKDKEASQVSVTVRDSFFNKKDTKETYCGFEPGFLIGKNL